jgi:hypothetical protein
MAGQAVALVEVSTDLAALDLGEVDAGSVLAGRQSHLGDLVAGALVVDEGPGPELADSEESRSLNVVALAVVACLLLGGDESGKWQARERVTRQEPL